MLNGKETIAWQTERKVANDHCQIKRNPYKSPEKDEKANENEAGGMKNEP
jgi:hypothetical protein